METGSGGHLASGLDGLRQDESPINICRKGFSHFQQQDYDGAIKNYEQAIALGAKSPSAYNMLGMAYRFKFQQTHDPAFARE